MKVDKRFPPGSFNFFSVKFANVVFQSAFQNKPRMFWTAVSHPQCSLANYLRCQVCYLVLLPYCGGKLAINFLQVEYHHFTWGYTVL